MSQLHCMAGFGGEGGAELEPELGLASEGSDSSHDQLTSPGSPHNDRKRLHKDVEMGGSGSGTESHGNESHGNESVGSSNDNSSSTKDSALMESSGSNKSPSPQRSSNAFSRVSSEQDNPSSSGCSSEQSAKAKTQKELFKTLKELKMHPPSDKRSKASTLNTLKYALRCVKQVKANEEYYQMLMTNDSQPPGLDVFSYTIEEIKRITSEYTNKNTDIFAMAVSLITGKIVYISDQAATILHCQREQFTNAKFVEFLTPQDVSVFYSFTTPYHLPSWSMCTGTESSPTEGMQEKSFFCRISGGKGRGGDLQYFPFRMTPYLMKVQDAELAEEQSCCLLLAERVQSGYDAPRIPSDKRIFTTTHTPSCVFQDIDERAVPLLGYLPQDLIGTPVLLHLHPSDRPLMLAVHHKILQYMGQPFEHSVRFCARNGEYVTIDTSWSSFVNPWSRKVSFVIGRHKVRMGPVNEDVFAVPAATEGKLMDSDIQQITEQIHRLLLQPVHNMGSSGYRSHGSNGSHEQLLSVGSPSETNRNGDALENRNGVEETGKSKPRTFQEICKGVHMLKSQDQQVYLPSPSHFPSSSPSSSEPESRKTTDRAQHLKSPVLFLKDLVVPPLLVNDSTAAASVEEVTCSDQTVYSYQQISCLDSVIKYLESCITPVTVKRKYQFSSNTTSSISDEDKKDSETAMQVSQDPGLSIKAPKKPPSGAVPVVGGPLAPLTLPSKAESVVSITSQCSYSSTIVHVGDKKPQPESEIIEDVAESPAPPALPVSVVSPPTQEKEAYKRLGLTKQVLAAHTHKEEQAFLTRCKELRNARTFQKDCSTYLHRQRGLTNMQEAAGTGGVFEQRAARPEASPAAAKKGSRNKKSKKPRMKYPDSSDSAVSHRKPRPPLQGLNQTSWSPSEASQSQAFSVPYPAVVPCYPLSGYSAAPTAPAQITCPDPSDSTGFGKGQSSQPLPTATPYPAPIVTPLVALVVPNYLFPQVGQMGQIDQMGQIGEMAQMGHIPQMGQVPQMGQISQLGQMAVAPRPSFFPEQPPCQPQPAYTSQHRSPGIPTQTTFNPQQAFQAPQMTYTTQQPFQTQTAYSNQLPFQAQTAYTTQQAFPSQPSFPVQAQLVPQASYPSQAFPFGLSSEPPKALAMETGEGAVSHCSTPSSTAREPTRSPPLFESRCSSSLQLNLLQLEDIRSVVGQDSMAPSSGAPRSRTSAEKSLAAQPEEDLQQVASSPDCAHSDGHSSSCDLLDVLLHDETDSSSVSGSGSGSGWRSVSRSGSGSNGRGTSSEASGMRNESNDTCKYFGSVDSLENEPKAKAKAKVKAMARERVETESEAGQSQVHSQGQGEYVLQEPLCLLMANADENIMMTYQMPSRDIQKVLREDQQRLRLMQKSQPHFSSVQQRELVKEQPWVRRGGLPKAINVKECMYCEDSALTPIEEDLSNTEEPTTRREESSTSHPDPAPPPGQRSPPPPLDTFTKLFIPVTNKHAPVKKMTVKNVKTPWIDEEL